MSLRNVVAEHLSWIIYLRQSVIHGCADTDRKGKKAELRSVMVTAQRTEGIVLLVAEEAMRPQSSCGSSCTEDWYCAGIIASMLVKQLITRNIDFKLLHQSRKVRPKFRSFVS